MFCPGEVHTTEIRDHWIHTRLCSRPWKRHSRWYIEWSRLNLSYTNAYYGLGNQGQCTVGHRISSGRRVSFGRVMLTWSHASHLCVVVYAPPAPAAQSSAARPADWTIGDFAGAMCDKECNSYVNHHGMPCICCNNIVILIL